jgi:quercetin dioxygenase-like cupin family protein
MVFLVLDPASLPQAVRQSSEYFSSESCQMAGVDCSSDRRLFNLAHSLLGVEFNAGSNFRGIRLKPILMHLIAMALIVSSVAVRAQTAKPELVFSDVLRGMPRGENQAIRVFTASFKPGDKTVVHTHRSPVTVYILEGAFTLELDGREPIVVKAGQAFVEPPNIKMTGYNRSTTDPLRLVIFYVSEPGTPFLDPLN